jgi:hypothetical protein
MYTAYIGGLIIWVWLIAFFVMFGSMDTIVLAQAGLCKHCYGVAFVYSVGLHHAYMHMGRSHGWHLRIMVGQSLGSSSIEGSCLCAGLGGIWIGMTSTKGSGDIGDNIALLFMSTHGTA